MTIPEVKMRSSVAPLLEKNPTTGKPTPCHNKLPAPGQDKASIALHVAMQQVVEEQKLHKWPMPKHKKDS